MEDWCQLISETVTTPPLSFFPLSSLPFTTSSLPFLPLIMDSFVPALRSSLESVCKEMEPKYPGITVDFLAKYFHDSLHVSPPVVASSAAEPAAAAPSLPAAAPAPTADSRKRVVSKKMTEEFIAVAVAGGLSDDQAKTRFEDVKKAYKTVSDADLESHGGSFLSYAKTFLGAGAAPAAAAPAPKPTKAKKEKKESRIAKWTPTLTRTLTKLVEESGGAMSDDIKASFHTFVDALEEETFKSLTLEAHMRRFIADRYAPSNAAGGSSSAAIAAAAISLPPSPPDEEEEDEELEDVVVDEEKLLIGVKSGKLYRATPAGDVWVGNAGVGRFSAVKVPSA